MSSKNIAGKEADLVSPAELHDLLSGRKRGFQASLLRLGLSFAEPFYTIGANWIRFLYNVRLKGIHRVSRPVISVGNITTGGTGKTPVTAMLVDLLKQQGHRPGIASRGYRALPGEEGDNPGATPAGNDEKLMLDQICPGTPHLQNRDRVKIARQLIREHECDCILLDDGFQHRRLDRQLDLVLIDALNPFGYGHLLPRGLLREPLTSLGRADLLAITRVDQASEEDLAGIRDILQQFTRAPIIEIAFEPTGWIDANGNSCPLDAFQGEAVGFCGIGNPRNFRGQLERLGVTLDDADWVPFPDHYHYTVDDVEALADRLDDSRSVLLTTQKDLVKVAPLLSANIPCYALQIQAVVRDGGEVLNQAVNELPYGGKP
ncbi:tetraacyldisaccharide 4'-kinase [Rubinisphaera sp. JC750]|uniref:tetraacyldisaccharide 4'-kinase n=1 Tax=Rubinisphaera sp. JC750 TaxID=2898658 RepID=UPI001F00C757|nr:tetraacyldisaccharide 4'-kinase [Rubinisphaera sp. JC750]